MQEYLNSFINYQIFGSDVLRWLQLFIVSGLIGGLAIYVLRYLQRKMAHRAIGRKIKLDALLALLIKRIYKLFVFVVTIVISARLLGFPPLFLAILGKLLIIATFFQLALWGNELIALWLKNYLARRIDCEEQDNSTISLATYGAINYITKFVLWLILFLVLLDNLGIDITALVTGLGIGGIAIALAVQNILGDMFASLTIILDKPFEVGDFIIVDDKMGSVESIGLKTSRIRSLSGEQLVFPNRQLIESQIRNYKRMSERRIVFGFGVLYDTGYERLSAIPKIVGEIIQETANCRLDRVHFKAYGESSLDFEVVYYMLAPDYTLYMDTQEIISLAIYKAFEEKNIGFAFPTRTLCIPGLEKLVNSTKPLQL